MIELFSSDTPNGKKISIMLEEIGFDYKVTKLDLISFTSPPSCLILTVSILLSPVTDSN